MKFKQWLKAIEDNLSPIKQYLGSSPPWFAGAAAAVFSVALWQFGAWQPLEWQVYKALFQIREAGFLPARGWDSRLAVIAVDPYSLQKYGQFPWRRDRYVDLLQALEQSPPAAIGFDILFLDPSSQDTKLAKAMAANGRAVLAKVAEEDVVPKLKAAAAGVGDILHQADADGISRSLNLFIDGSPSLGVATLQVYSKSRPDSISVPQLLPGEKPKIWLNWPGKTENVPTYAFADVVDGKIPPQDLTDKLVLLGLVADGWDPVSSPLDRTTAGVYSHVALIDNLLNDRYLRRPPNWLVLLALLAIGPTTSWLLGDRNLRDRLAIVWGLPVGWFILAALLFGFSYWWLPVAAPIGTAFLGAIALQLREQYEKQQLMSLFEKHVAPETARMIWERKGEIFRDGELEPQEVTATVLFMDIRSFTSISETMTPRELLGWLNDYLDAMTDCIMDRGGVVDKYIGDAIMACFGVPFPRSKNLDVKEDAINAVAACIDMHRRLEQLNQKLKDQGKALIRFGIGLHTGPLVAGSVGGHRRVNYSVIGDTVNTAARLESMNKQLTADRDYQILVTEETFALVSDRYLGQQVDAIQLRGKTQKTVIFNILGEKSQEIQANVTNY